MALAVGVPAAFGRTDLGLLASAGALTALYLAPRPRRERARRLPVLQLGFLAAAAIGAATGSSPLAPLVLAAVTIAAAVLVLGFAVGPPGRAVLRADRRRHRAGSPRPRPPGAPGWIRGSCSAWRPPAACSPTSSRSCRSVIPAVRRREAALPVAPLAFTIDATTRIVLLRLAIAALLAAALGAALGLHRTYWVLLAVVATLQAGRSRRLTAVRGVNRVLGTLVGVAAFALLALLAPQGLLLALVVGLLQLVTELVIVRHYGLALVFITPLALTIAEAGSGRSRAPARAGSRRRHGRPVRPSRSACWSPTSASSVSSGLRPALKRGIERTCQPS